MKQRFHSIHYAAYGTPCAVSITCLFAFKVLLVTSSRRPDSWIVPGGGVEPEEEPAITALREVREEAGVLGQLGRCLGVFEVLNICAVQIIGIIIIYNKNN